jgi:hypothetical protein
VLKSRTSSSKSLILELDLHLNFITFMGNGGAEPEQGNEEIEKKRINLFFLRRS